MQNSYDYLIIGGGVAGMTAAETIRSKNDGCSIAIIGAEPHASYSRVLLPKVVRGEIAEERVFLKKADFFSQRRIDFITGVSVQSIVTAENTVMLSDGQSFSYGALLIATGGTPRTLSYPGAAEAGCLYFQTIEDARTLAGLDGGDAIVVGGGFIAIELATAFAHAGCKVTIVVRGASFFWRTLDERSGAKIRAQMEQRGVTVRYNSEVRGITMSGDRKTVHFTSGDTVDCRYIGVGIGLEPNVGFLADSGIPVGRGVQTDQYLRTAVSNVYAVGDVAEFYDSLVGEYRVVGNWMNALLQGKTAGLNMCGIATAYAQLTSYAISCFGLQITFLGATEIVCERSLVREYPDGSVVQLRVVHNRVIGATCVGSFRERAAVTKLINEKILLSEKKMDVVGDSQVSLEALIE